MVLEHNSEMTSEFIKKFCDFYKNIKDGDIMKRNLERYTFPYSHGSNILRGCFDEN